MKNPTTTTKKNAPKKRAFHSFSVPAGAEIHDEPSDDLNPKYIFSSTHKELLLQIVKGAIDTKCTALWELRNRGYDTDGKWIGCNATPDKFNPEDYRALINHSGEEIYVLKPVFESAAATFELGKEWMIPVLDIAGVPHVIILENQKFAK